ncbi:hypothetical protein ASG40_09245 [Methylobacterium sp. Leaf399]|uniref:hypothetical protein n=1 Tax=unclassified Methylobacterium TaxID=2615210 RepID=UPI0006F3D28D|nr:MULTISPECIES: hypothetical protein [unclassified Methylobacterium]KQP55169.1 hypothetical protein ASF39_05485 [Methylobacterium sp. Leaf108]KQT09909.1 hypothetical protein ASG40_09245 [Methylobacterium sp. Leaf399]KQT77858.1 hypothetical protein ASG59_11060 [Methylobacterium sp. Leaf466]
MRLSLATALFLAAASPALAQLSGNPDSLNATNERLSNQSQIRGIQQQQQFENNQMRMQIQRNDAFRAAPAPTIVVPPRR